MKNINDKTNELINLIFKKLKCYKNLNIKISIEEVEDLIVHLKNNN